VENLQKELHACESEGKDRQHKSRLGSLEIQAPVIVWWVHKLQAQLPA
jgi:hypothetical protein